MCELFAMSSSRPTALTYSFEEFSKNGSKLRSNRDGWGIAFYDGKGRPTKKQRRDIDDFKSRL